MGLQRLKTAVSWFLHSNTDQQGMPFALNPAAFHFRFGDRTLDEEQNLHRCDYGGTRLLSASFVIAAQTIKARTLP